MSRKIQPPLAKTRLSELLDSLGKARIASTNAYQSYREVKDSEDQLRYELEQELRSIGLKSAKGQDYTASIIEKPTVVVRNETEVIGWLNNTPDIESDLYIGLKPVQFQSLARSILQGTGETIPGTEVEVRESLAIRSNKKEK